MQVRDVQFIDLDLASCKNGERAMTPWYDMALMKIVARQDWSDSGAKGGVFRLAVVPMNAVEAAVYLQVVPLGLEKFRAHLVTLEQDEYMTGLAAIRFPEVGKI